MSTAAYGEDVLRSRQCGVAVAYGKVFIGTVDAGLIAWIRQRQAVWDIPLVGTSTA